MRLTPRLDKDEGPSGAPDSKATDAKSRRWRPTRVRAKIAAMLVSLSALWVFSAWVTVADGVNLLWATTIDGLIAQPSEPLLWGLQRERRLTIATLEASSTADRQVQAQRAANDGFRTAFEESARSDTLRWAADDTLELRTGEVLRQLATLPKLRQSVDAGQLNREKAQEAYDSLIDGFYRMYDAVAALDDEKIARDGRTLAAMSRARELMARQDTLVTGILASGRFTSEEQTSIIKAASVYDYAVKQASTALPTTDHEAFQAWTASRPVNQLRAFERELTNPESVGGQPTVGLQEWRSAADGALDGLNTVIQVGGDRLVERATPVAIGVLSRLLLAGGLGLLAVVASIVLAVTTSRALLAQLRRLRDAAHELAQRRLPDVVDRVGHGENVDLASEAPPLDFGSADEIGQVAQAFNRVQQTALATAVQQAELRRTHRSVLTNLARRTQSQITRTLSLLDAMQRRTTAPEELDDLFALDQLAVRTRRNAENLLVLSGASPARTWRRTVPFVDLVRGALAEVEDFTRVSVAPLGDTHLVGKAVGDVIHLLAELIENAVSFSPPATKVLVSGEFVANGYVLEIEDRGLGIPPEELAEANRLIADPPEFKITGSTAQLGWYVVSQLAARHNIKVTLKSSPYGGTTVVVLVPRELVRDESDFIEDVVPPAPPRPAPAFGIPAARRGPDTVSRRGTDTAARRGTEPAARRGTEPAARRGTEPVVPAMATGAAPPLPIRTTAARPARPPAPAPDPQPAPGAAPEPERGQAKTGATTPSGLPLRTPQTHLPPEMLAQPAAPSATHPPEAQPEPAEETRSRLAALQDGTNRGRLAAQRSDLSLRDHDGPKEAG